LFFTVRQQNQKLIEGIQVKTSTLNTTNNGYNNNTNTNSPSSSSSTLSPLISIDDQDETNNNNQNSNNNSPNNINSPSSSSTGSLKEGQSLTRTGGMITIDPEESELPESPGRKMRPTILTDEGGGTNKQVEKVKEKAKPLSSSLIGAVLLDPMKFPETFDTTSSSNIDNSFFIKPGESRESSVEATRVAGGNSRPSLFVDENEPKNSPTEFRSENSNILLGQISDIDEVEERVRTSIVLR